MRAVAVSLVLAAVGVAVSRAITARLVRHGGERDAHVYWALGLVALVPGWVAAFIGLLGAAPVRRPEMIPAVAWTVSAATALIGAIATESVVRHAAERWDARSPESHGGKESAMWQWGVGALALVPALAAALLGLLLR